MKLVDLLNARQVSFERLKHPTTFGAQRVARTLHVRPREMAKTVLLRTGEGYVITVLTANQRVDLEKVRECLGDDWVEVASEGEMTRVFPDCETGAMPPFGSLYNVQTLVDESLAEDEAIVFEGHNHEEAIRMAYKDFEAIEHPRKGHFAMPAG
jgi:Ala-tRNA(Pro) deacylase